VCRPPPGRVGRSHSNRHSCVQHPSPTRPGGGSWAARFMRLRRHSLISLKVYVHSPHHIALRTTWMPSGRKHRAAGRHGNSSPTSWTPTLYPRHRGSAGRPRLRPDPPSWSSIIIPGNGLPHDRRSLAWSSVTLAAGFSAGGWVEVYGQRPGLGTPETGSWFFLAARSRHLAQAPAGVYALIVWHVNGLSLPGPRIRHG
jgi:hypothetical protein